MFGLSKQTHLNEKMKLYASVFIRIKRAPGQQSAEAFLISACSAREKSMTGKTRCDDETLTLFV